VENLRPLRFKDQDWMPRAKLGRDFGPLKIALVRAVAAVAAQPITIVSAVHPKDDSTTADGPKKERKSSNG
jgi:hypothetical protein